MALDHFLGREIAAAVEISFTYTDATTVPTDHVTLGGVRNAPIGFTSSTADATSADSDGWLEKLTASKSGDNTIEGVMKKTTASNLDAVEDFYLGTDQPIAWLKLTRPTKPSGVPADQNKVYDYAVMITGFEITGQYDDTVTYTITYETTGAPITSYEAA